MNRRLRAVFIALVSLLIAAFPLQVPAASSGTADAYNRILSKLRSRYSVAYARQLDLDGDGNAELITVYTDGIIRSYDSGSFTSEYTLKVFTFDPHLHRTVPAGKLTGLFYDAGIGGGIQALALAKYGDEYYIVNGGTDMNYRYRFYGIRSGRLKLIRSYHCEWAEGLCYINGSRTSRDNFLAELRNWQKDISYLHYFSSPFTSPGQAA